MAYFLVATIALLAVIAYQIWKNNLLKQAEVRTAERREREKSLEKKCPKIFEDRNCVLVPGTWLILGCLSFLAARIAFASCHNYLVAPMAQRFISITPLPIVIVILLSVFWVRKDLVVRGRRVSSHVGLGFAGILSVLYSALTIMSVGAAMIIGNALINAFIRESWGACLSLSIVLAMLLAALIIAVPTLSVPDAWSMVSYGRGVLRKLLLSGIIVFACDWMFTARAFTGAPTAFPTVETCPGPSSTLAVVGESIKSIPALFMLLVTMMVCNVVIRHLGAQDHNTRTSLSG